jgi:hypothetical protein
MLGHHGIEKIYEIPIADRWKDQLKLSTNLIEETISKLEIDI